MGEGELPAEARNKAIALWQQYLLAMGLNQSDYTVTTPYTRICLEFTEQDLSIRFCHLA